jgi:hypothetical protein
MELLLGRPEAALEHRRAAIARLDGFGASAGAGHPYHHVMTALILLNRLDDAVAAGRKAHAGRRRLLDALSLALLAAMQGRLAGAACIIGFDDFGACYQQALVHARAGIVVRPHAVLLQHPPRPAACRRSGCANSRACAR